MKNYIAKLVDIKKFEIFEEEIPKLPNDHVLVKISSSGICGSDLHFYRHGGLGSAKLDFPLSLGHETCGVIIDRNNTNFKNFSDVVIDPLNVSKCNHTKKIGDCGFKRNLCPHQSYLGSKPTDGSFRTFLIVHKSQVTRLISSKIDIEEGAMVEPAGIAQFSIERAQMKKNEEYKILILGAGAIGLLISSISANLYKSQNYIIDNINHRLEIAKKYFKSKKILKSNLKKIPNEYINSFDIVFDCITNNESLKFAINALKNSGKLIVVGIPEQDFLLLNPHKTRIKQIDIMNIRRSNIEFDKTINLIENYNVPLKKLITHKYSLKNIEKGFKQASEYKDNVIRSLIV